MGGRKVTGGLPAGLGDARSRGLLFDPRLEVMFDQVAPEKLERFGGPVRVVHQGEILFGDRTPFDHRAEIKHLVPVLAAVQDDADLLRELVGLREGQQLEQLVARSKTAWKDDERLREVRK